VRAEQEHGDAAGRRGILDSVNGLLIGLVLLVTQGVIARQWQAVRGPSSGAAQAVGGTSNGCLQGAGTLPVSGPGYEVARVGRNRRYGHPALIGFIQQLQCHWGGREAILRV